MYVCVWGGRGGAAGWVRSLIPEENVEEINLNYKDEASLESGSGRATEGREGGRGGRGVRGETAITPVLFCILVAVFVFVFFFFFPHPVGMRWPVFLPLWLATQTPLLHLLTHRPLTN